MKDIYFKVFLITWNKKEKLDLHKNESYLL